MSRFADDVWTVTTGTFVEQADGIDFVDGSNLSHGIITVTCSSGGAAVIASPENTGYFSGVQCQPASDNAATTWTVSVATALGPVIGTVSGSSATAGKYEFPNEPVPLSADGLVFTVAGMTASKNITIKYVIKD